MAEKERDRGQRERERQRWRQRRRQTGESGKDNGDTTYIGLFNSEQNLKRFNKEMVGLYSLLILWSVRLILMFMLDLVFDLRIEVS